MTCHICGGELQPTHSDTPFNVDESHIVIFKSLPILQCGQCGSYLIEDAVMERLEELLAGADADAELEVVRFAA
jgi:YgiT-type zinc finger domain-containing protein